MTRISSRKYLNAAKGQECTFQIPGVCNCDPSTTVPCHLRDEVHGRSIKADDISIADGCSSCHDMMDGRSGVLSKEEWLFYALRGLQRTLKRRIEQGVLFLPQDAPKQPKPVVRKPKGQRVKIQGRKDWPKGRKLRSKNTLRKD